jgi:hypothetical protein
MKIYNQFVLITGLAYYNNLEPYIKALKNVNAIDSPRFEVNNTGLQTILQ